MYEQSTRGLAMVLGWCGYFLLAYALKAWIYPRHLEPPRPFPKRWIGGHEATILFSIDFWLAHCFKSRIAQFTPDTLRRSCLKKFVRDNNHLNLLLSIAMFLLLVGTRAMRGAPVFTGIVASMCVLRWISRSWEIAFAFGRDAMRPGENSSGHDKYERLQLAMRSYAEIFVFSAGAYLALNLSATALAAISWSLGIGTLTNAGIAFSAGVGWLGNIVFVQVFTTMSLVVLSLAAYLARTD